METGHLIEARLEQGTLLSISPQPECHPTMTRRRRSGSQIYRCHNRGSRMVLMAIIQCLSSCMALWHRWSGPDQGCSQRDKRFHGQRSYKYVSLMVMLACRSYKDQLTLQLVARSSNPMPELMIEIDTLLTK